jgi:hypothetical protein
MAIKLAAHRIVQCRQQVPVSPMAHPQQQNQKHDGPAVRSLVPQRGEIDKQLGGRTHTPLPDEHRVFGRERAKEDRFFGLLRTSCTAEPYSIVIIGRQKASTAP